MYMANQQHKIAITGGIGSGKSVVSRLLRMMGVPVYDCDTRAKCLMNESPTLRTALIQAVGDNIYGPDGNINRPFLAAYMFGNPEHVNTINHIVHPTVRTDFLQWAQHTQAPIVAVETAILYESGMDADVDAVLLVHTPLDLRIRRAAERDHTTEAAIRQRIEAQTSDEELLRRATYVITNEENTSLISQVCQLIHAIEELGK